MKVLYVDDYDMDRKLVRAALKADGGFKLTETASREQFEASLVEGDYDVVLSDFHMFGFDGLEAIDLVQKRSPGVPIIIVTGTGTEEVAVEAWKRGAADYVLKTAKHIRRLPVTIRSALEKIELERERRQAKERLRERERDLTEAQRLAHLGSWDWDLQTGQVKWSDEVYRIFGLDPEHFEPQIDSIMSRFHPDDWSEYEEVTRQAIANHDRYTFESRILLPDGSERALSSTSEGRYDDEGNLTHIFGTVLDITERKRMETELRERQKELAHLGRLATMGEMAAGIAHELKQPLQAIANYAKGISMRLENAAANSRELSEATEKIIGQTQRGSDIIDRVQSNAKKCEPRRIATDLNQLLQDLLKLVEHELGQEQVALELDLQEDLPFVLADPVQIQQVAMNLIRNALDAMHDAQPDHRRLTLATSVADGDMVEVTVGDTGEGLNEETREKVFDAFFTTKTDGLGMGLAISRTIVLAHEGEIWTSPNTPEGTVFRFTVPTA